MKKIMIIALLLASTGVFAEGPKKLPAVPYPAHSDYFLESLDGARSMGRDIYVDESTLPATVEQPSRAPLAEASDPVVGYTNPAGTLFLGMDESGKGTWFSRPGVIGAWSDTIKCWKWNNNITDYKTIKYVTLFADRNPSMVENAYYYVDAKGNFYDSIVSGGGLQEAYAMDADGDAGYIWQQATPLQTVTFEDGTSQSFLLLSSAKNPSAQNCPLAAGGLPSGNSSDGLWPLTNAVNVNQNGVSADLIAETDEDGYVHYIFGPKAINTDIDTVRNVADTEDSVVYTRSKPVLLRTMYDKPQAPLYIKSVTMALGSDKYSAFNQSDLHFDTLYMTILTEGGDTLASSLATMANISAVSYQKCKGKIVHFLMRDTTAYGELLSEGVLISDAFRIDIRGFKEEDNWGIYAAKSTVHDSKSYIEYENGLINIQDYDPYIMLNGIYPTLEDYYVTRGAKTGQVGDTIPVKMIEYETGRYHYTAAYKDWGTANTEFAFYSTFTPYDSISRTWNMDIVQPDYIEITADYETVIGGGDDDEEPITLWSYYRLFTMHIYATGTPQVGDLIKISKAGKQIVFRIDQVGEKSQGLEDIHYGNKAEKILHNGMIFIRKNGAIYNTLGIRIR